MPPQLKTKTWNISKWFGIRIEKLFLIKVVSLLYTLDDDLPQSFMVQTLEFIRRAEISCNLLGQNQKCRHDQHSLLHFDYFYRNCRCVNSILTIEYNFPKRDTIKAKALIYELPHKEHIWKFRSKAAASPALLLITPLCKKEKEKAKAKRVGINPI